MGGDCSISIAIISIWMSMKMLKGDYDKDISPSFKI